MGLAQIFGQNVRRVRREKGMTLEALAHEVGIAYTYLGQVERGSRNPTLDVVERIGEALAIDPRALLRTLD
jgi:transcriptional regulator with XRE-family HTH domain